MFVSNPVTTILASASAILISHLLMTWENSSLVSLPLPSLSRFLKLLLISWYCLWMLSRILFSISAEAWPLRPVLSMGAEKGRTAGLVLFLDFGVAPLMSLVLLV